MKKILSIGLILLLVAAMFTLAACGGENMQEDMTSISDEMSSDMSSLDDELTENGNITDGTTEKDTLTSDEGIIDDITDALTTEGGTVTTSTSAAE